MISLMNVQPVTLLIKLVDCFPLSMLSIKLQLKAVKRIYVS